MVLIREEAQYDEVEECSSGTDLLLRFAGLGNLLLGGLETLSETLVRRILATNTGKGRAKQTSNPAPAVAKTCLY